MLRNDKNKPLISNGARRHGQYEWHDESCQIEDYGIILKGVEQPYRLIWCATHGQWAIEKPVKITWEFELGEKIIKNFT